METTFQSAKPSSTPCCASLGAHNSAPLRVLAARATGALREEVAAPRGRRPTEAPRAEAWCRGCPEATTLRCGGCPEATTLRLTEGPAALWLAEGSAALWLLWLTESSAALWLAKGTAACRVATRAAAKHAACTTATALRRLSAPEAEHAWLLLLLLRLGLAEDPTAALRLLLRLAEDPTAACRLLLWLTEGRLLLLLRLAEDPTAAESRLLWLLRLAEDAAAACGLLLLRRLAEDAPAASRARWLPEDAPTAA